MKKLMKACTLSLAALGALTFFQTEGAHAAAQPTKEPVIAKAPIMNKVIKVNRTLTVGSSIAVSLPASQISVSGATYAIQLDQTAPNFTWIRAVQRGSVTVFYYNSLGELVINYITIR
ncbi:hypothetical protein M3579_11430 [Bacillus pumilus]|uniref:hypothetical protein n=1 Tax=Bacillus pumilus TaxID=1408 RepID=UPI0020414BF3|nr:hypothetical protein [Bacillus pumilus]MCM3036571.1 hypothetical protein [Bacillus pumilus]